jgi:hypothetical protein
MVSLSEVTTLEFREGLTPSAVRVSQMIHFALAAGTAAADAMSMILYYRGIDLVPTEDALSLVSNLSAIQAAYAVISWFLAKYLFERQFSSSSLADGVSRTYTDKDGHPLHLKPAEKCIGLIRVAWIIRLGVLLSASYFGVVVVIIAAINGVAQTYPEYLLNLVTGVLFLGYVFLTFPTAERIEETYESRFHR